MTRSPGLAAVDDGTQVWTYADLDERSSQIAASITAATDAEQPRVGVLMEPSADRIAALAGVLQAGGLYVPIDARSPSSRQTAMLRAAAVDTVVVDDPAADLVPDGYGRLLVRPGDDPRFLGREASDPPASRAAPVPGAACILFTSGSTGTPKGAVIGHAGLANLVTGQEYLSLAPGRRMAQVGSIAFDASTFEIWAPLLAGACVVVLPPTVLLRPRDLMRAFRDGAVDSAFVTTAVAHRLAADDAVTELGALSTLVFGGEAASPAAMRRLLSHAGECRLVNVYGPTEATSLATWFDVRALARDATVVPVGRPLRGVGVLVVDELGEPVERGEPGELVISGAGVGLGYVNDPGDRDPFGWIDGVGRVYRSGDLARENDDGDFEVLGRLDDQVKISGFRIEPGEVVAAARDLPGVADAAVTSFRTKFGEQALALYVVVDAAGAAGAADEAARAGIREALRDVLPEFMIPRAVEVLPELPLTVVGKVDRSKLPPPASDRPPARTPFVEPRTPDETAVASIFETTTGVTPIGAVDDFFEMGGHSLLAAQLVALVGERFGVELAIEAVFDLRTVEAIAQAIPSLAPLEAGTLPVRLVVFDPR